jgi:glycine cleavage system H protein
MTFPNNLKYTKDHEWVSVDGNVGTIGITDFAQSELGDIVFVELPSKGKKLKTHETFGTIEAVKTVSDLFAPISGEIVEVNSALESNAEVINKDPYNGGWIVKMKIADAKELNSLLTANQYRELVGK